MFNWIQGRQGGGYSKLKLIVSERFKFDLYILKIPAGTKIQKHKDPAQPGFCHHRLNFTFSGPFRKMYVLGTIKRWWRAELFRPDLFEHGLEPVSEDIYMVSLGWLTKAN